MKARSSKKSMDVSDVNAPVILSSIPQHDDDSKHLDREGRNTATHVAREVALLASASRHLRCVARRACQCSWNVTPFPLCYFVAFVVCLNPRVLPRESNRCSVFFLNRHDFSCTHRLDASLVFHPRAKKRFRGGTCEAPLQSDNRARRIAATTGIAGGRDN